MKRTYLPTILLLTMALSACSSASTGQSSDSANASATAQPKEKWVCTEINYTNGAFNHTTYAYDEHGGKIEEANETDDYKEVKKYDLTYDDHGSVTNTTTDQYIYNWKGSKDVSVKKGISLVITDYEYDDQDRITSKRITKSGKLDSWHRFEYDDQNRKIKDTACSYKGEPVSWIETEYTDWGDVKSSTEYDENGIVKSISTYTYEYDDSHLPVKETLGNGNTVTITCEADSAGRITSKKSVVDQLQTGRLEEYTYDDQDRITSYKYSSFSTNSSDMIIDGYWKKQYYDDGHSYMQTNYNYNEEPASTEEHLYLPLSQAVAKNTEKNSDTKLADDIGSWLMDNQRGELLISSVEGDNISFSLTFYRLCSVDQITAVLSDDSTASFSSSDLGASGKLIFKENEIDISFDDTAANKKTLTMLGQNEFVCHPANTE